MKTKSYPVRSRGHEESRKPCASWARRAPAITRFIVVIGCLLLSGTDHLAAGILPPLLGPTISDIPDLTIDEDTTSGPLDFTIDLASSLLGNLTKDSSNPALVPLDN